MIYHKNKPESIQEMFDSIAKRYDLTNAVLSFSLHRYWNRRLVKTMRQPHPASTLVDLCSGTGDIAFGYLKSIQVPCQAYLVDFSAGMLEYAKQKFEAFPSSHTIHYIESDVQQLPLPNHLADCATMAYGIRNVKDPARCFQEAFRVLKPGGNLGILELTRPRYRVLRWGHHLYLRYFLPLIGHWLTDNQEAYRYLCQSIHTFIAPEELEKLLQQEGFVETKRISLLGGIATIVVGTKPQ